MTTKIICCGNLILGDEGFGIHVYNELEKLNLPKNVEIVDAGTGGLDILNFLEKADKVIFVDAVISGNSPGTIYRLTEKDLDGANLSVNSAHELKLEHVLKMAEQLFEKKPEIVIFGIEIEKIGNFSMELTPAVQKSIPRVTQLVLREVK